MLASFGPPFLPLRVALLALLLLSLPLPLSPCLSPRKLTTVPSLPLAMAAGGLFGQSLGLALVSFSATVAATIAFLIARRLARARVAALVGGDARFAAIDRALARDGLKVITLLRLSPLLPLAAANYLYGITSLKLGPFVLGSWAGMLPGCWALVSAGQLGASVAVGGAGALGGAGGLARLAAGILAGALAIAVVAKAAQDAISEPGEEGKPE